MKIWGFHLFALVVLVQVLIIAAFTNPNDSVALQALANYWKKVPVSWTGADPCGSGWDGVTCTNSHVISIIVPNFNLVGQISSDVTTLSELQILDLSYNKGLIGPLPASIGNLKKLTSLSLVGSGFYGPIPPSIGSLPMLHYLALNSNNFTGEIPPTIGNLANLYWLDLGDNRLTGSIPVSSGSTRGLDMLVNAKHFHFANNKLSGEIPSFLFSSSMTLIHLLLDNNQLTGSIPSTLGLVQSLEIIRLDGNSLSGLVPQNLNNLTAVQELYLSNNQLTGPLPNLTGMNSLNYVDLSNNSFDPTDIPPWFSSLESLTTLVMEHIGIQGPLLPSLFSLYQLQTVILKSNRINGTFDIGPNPSSQLQLIDLQSNLINSFTQRLHYTYQIILIDNPICTQRHREDYCSMPRPSNMSYSTPSKNCVPEPCNIDQVSSPTCNCAYPYTGILIFRAPPFYDYGNATRFASLKKKMMDAFQLKGLPVDSLSLSNPTKNLDNYLLMSLQIFPSGQDYFNHSGISGVAFILNNQPFKPPDEVGPYYFIGDSYPYIDGMSAGSKKSVSIGVIVASVIGGAVLLLLLVLAGVYAFRQKRRAEIADKKNHPFAKWDSKTDSGGVPQLKGVKSFSFEELKKWTDNFSETNDIGRGGYGKVYRGTLPNGQLVAIKRAQQGSTQGGLEFKTEIELLSRVHHKNVVSLVGFCFDQGEQMLVYEYIPNGTLKDSLSGKSGIVLDWARRLRISLGAAKGLQYLHDLANPPIIHRDIKSNNILLDDRLNAKVADFGLSKPIGEPERSYVTTQVKGTMGYLDPEYYMTNQLTEKSDVYSFGVLLFELLTGRTPIEKGKYIVREVKTAMDNNRELYNLRGLLEPIVAISTSPRSVEKFVNLALRCVEETGVKRPPMSEVVKELENILILAGLNPNL